MGGIVKSIGRAVSKIGKGLKKAIKKIGPYLILAAAVWAGVSALGAHSLGTLGSGSMFSTGNFSAGLGTIGKGIGNFFMPGSFGTQKSKWVPDVVGGKTMTTGKMISEYVGKAGDKNMSTADALMYMTKMNMFATGAKMVAGYLEPTEAELEEEKAEKKHQRLVEGIQKYSSGIAPMTDPLAEFAPGALQQSISEPTFGRSSTRNLMSSAPRSTAYSGQGSSALSSGRPGLITQGTQKRLT